MYDTRQRGEGLKRPYLNKRALRLRRVERDERAFEAIALVAVAAGLHVELLLRPGRGPRAVAEARHLAMYLTHVAVGRQYLQVARLFGRDRTTVAYACALVEDRRDEPEFEARITAFEKALDAEAMEFAHAA